MKKIILTVLILNSFIICGEDKLIFHQNHPDSISELIAANFLQEKKIYAENRRYYEKERTDEESIFDCSPAHLHDVQIQIRREGFGDSAIVMLESIVRGAIEEFEEKNILENEKKLLKFVLLETYFEKLKKIQADGCDIPTIVPIDKFTKVTSHPVPIFTTEIYYSLKEAGESKNPRKMTFTTFYLASEFDDLVNKYFYDK